MGWLHAVTNFADRRREPVPPSGRGLLCTAQPVADWAIFAQQIGRRLTGLDHAH